jgi:hypothetical protein
MDRRLRIFGNLLVYLLFTSFLAFAALTLWHEKPDPSHAGAFRTADRIWVEHTTLAVVHHLLSAPCLPSVCSLLPPGACLQCLLLSSAVVGTLRPQTRSSSPSCSLTRCASQHTTLSMNIDVICLLGCLGTVLFNGGRSGQLVRSLG